MYVSFGVICIAGEIRLVQLCVRARNLMPSVRWKQAVQCGAIGAAAFLFGFLIWNLDK